MQLNEIGSRPTYVDKNYNPYDISREDFLKIYLKTLELQDPTEPLDTKAMIEQNYQLQQISFLTKLQATMQSLAQAQQLGNITQAGFLIGKDVVIKTDAIRDLSANYVLLSPQAYSGVTISIVDSSNGQVVKSYTTDLQRGINPLDTDDLSPGEYSLRVTSPQGEPIDGIVLGEEGTVQYISLLGNEPILGLPFGERPLKDIVYISA